MDCIRKRWRDVNGGSPRMVVSVAVGAGNGLHQQEPERCRSSTQLLNYQLQSDLSLKSMTLVGYKQNKDVWDGPCSLVNVLNGSKCIVNPEV